VCLDRGAAFDDTAVSHQENLAMSDATSIAADQLKSIVERIERLEEDKKAIAEDIKEVYAEAKANGLDNAILRKIVALRKKPAAERAEEDAILELYLQALGMSN
jgi:uncharacterized protein (UPF0335 family)